MYRLALQVGEWDAEGMMAAMSSRQRAYWEAFYEREPWGDQRDDLRNGVLISAIDGMFRGEESQAEPIHFVQKFERKKKRRSEGGQSPEEMMANLGAAIQSSRRRD